MYERYGLVFSILRSEIEPRIEIEAICLVALWLLEVDFGRIHRPSLIDK